MKKLAAPLLKEAKVVLKQLAADSKAGRHEHVLIGSKKLLDSFGSVSKFIAKAGVQLGNDKHAVKLGQEAVELSMQRELLDFGKGKERTLDTLIGKVQRDINQLSKLPGIPQDAILTAKAELNGLKQQVANSASLDGDTTLDLKGQTYDIRLNLIDVQLQYR